MRVLIIVPAYNEQDALGGVLDELRALREPGVAFETVVVDDGSLDRTAEVARAGGARVLRLCGNLGIGGAVQSGIRLARREGYDAAIQLDGDGQHPASEVARLIASEKLADLLVGVRGRGPTTVLRRIGSAWLRIVLRVIARVKISDPTSGFRLYGRKALELFDETYPYDYPEPESLAVARANALRVDEVAVSMRERQGGRSSIAGFGALYYMIKVTVAVVLAYLRARRRPRREIHDAAS